MNNLAPIVLFVYNRPWHTRQTVEALQKNDLASESDLYIYADGAKNDTALPQVQEVRSYLKTISGFKAVHIIEREKNWGLADNIIDGVTHIVNTYGRIIVLEDDIVTSVGFLKFMNNALEMYEYEGRVMHISGYMFPVKKKMPNTFFYNTASCWGWGTWQRAWKYFNSDAKYLLNQLYQRKLIVKFNLNGAYKYTDQLINNISNTQKTWAIKWYASFFLANGCALHPYPSFVNNIGFDGSGIHCDDDKNSIFHWNELREDAHISKLTKFDDSNARKVLQDFFKPVESIPKRIRQNLKQFVPPILMNAFRKLKTSKQDSLNELPRYIQGETTLLGKTVGFPDIASFKFIYSEIFEKQIYKFHCSSPVPYLIDAGANIGLAVIYFKQLFPQAQIVAIEPDEEIFEYLQKNTYHFGKSIELIKKALWSEITELPFMSDGADGGRLNKDNNMFTIKKVQTTLLSKFITKRVDFLKIDIEGSELEVLIECKDKLHLVDNIFVEYHSFANKLQNLNLILQILSDNGFRYNIQHVGVLSNHPFEKIMIHAGMDNQLNIFATKKQ